MRRAGPAESFDVAWGSSGGSRGWLGQVQGVVELEGRAHLHVTWAAPGREPVVVQEAWLRAEGQAWVCARRRVGAATFAIEPPLPILRAPLEPGARWSWSGRVAGEPARAEFEVLTPPEPELLLVRQRIQLEGGIESEVLRTYRAGAGLVAEEGSFPYEPEGDTHRSRIRSTPPLERAPAKKSS